MKVIFVTGQELQNQGGGGAGPDLQGQEQQEQQHDLLAEEGQ